MTMIALDLSTVPDTLPVPPAGIYQFKIEKAPEVKPSKEVNEQLGRHSNVVNIAIKLQNPGEFMDKEMLDWANIDFENGKVKLRRLYLSCGLPATNGVDLNQLVGKTGFCTVTNSVDSKSGRPIQRANIGDYLIPGEPGHPSPKQS